MANQRVPIRVAALTPRRLRSFLRRHAFDGRYPRIREHIRSGRNRIFIIDGLDGQSWIAKQDLLSSSAEAWFYSEVAPHFAFAPTCLAVDAGANIVIIERVVDSVTLQQECLADPGAALRALPDLAIALAHLHQASPGPAVTPSAHPPLAQLDPIDIRHWLNSAPAARELVTYVQTRCLLGHALREAIRGVGPHGLIHGDIKIDNILRRSSGQLVVVDWELCGKGALGWDVGAALGSVLVLWSDRLALKAEGTVAEWIAQGAIPFAELYRAARRFIKTYRDHTRSGNVLAPERRVVALHTAAWILSRTWADAAAADQLTPHQLLRLAICEGLVRDPSELFGELNW